MRSTKTKNKSASPVVAQPGNGALDTSRGCPIPGEAPGGHTAFSRRRLLTEGAVAGGVALATASCAINDPDPLSPTGGAIEAPRVDQVPSSDPFSRTWDYGYPMEITLDGQVMANPQRALPSEPSLTVRAIHDGTTIGFRIEWADADKSDSAAQPQLFRDAVAVLLAPGAGDELLRTMGSATTAATILHWKADWQQQADGNMQGVRETFPNSSVDYYPPLVKVEPSTVTARSYEEAKATQWLPGLHSHNPMSAATRKTPVEKLTARSYGTLTSCATQNATGNGAYRDTGWVAALAKPLASTDPDEITLQAGSTYTVAFAMWSGSSGDVGSKKSPSKTTHALKLGA